MDKGKDWVMVCAGRNGNTVSLAVDKGVCGGYGYRHHHGVSSYSLSRLWAVLASNHWQVRPMVDGWNARPPYSFELAGEVSSPVQARDEVSNPVQVRGQEAGDDAA